MNGALVQDAQHQVHHHHGGQHQPQRVRQRCPERLGRPQETALDGQRPAQLLLHLFHGRHRIPQRMAVAQVEGQRGRRELRLMVHHHRRLAVAPVRQGGKRHRRAVGRRHEHVVQRRHALGPRRILLQHHAVLVGLREERGNLPLREGILQGRGDGLHLHAQAGGSGAVNLHVGLPAVVLQIAADVGQLGPLGQRGLQARHPLGQQSRVGGAQRHLVLGAADAVLDGQFLHRLEPHTHGLAFGHRTVGHFPAQARDDGLHVIAAVFVRFQVEQHAAGAERRVAAIHADERRQALHIRIGQQLRRHGFLLALHRLEGDGAGRLRHHLDHATVLHREKALRHGQIEQHRGRERGQHHPQHQRLVVEHAVQAAAIGGDEAVEKTCMSGRTGISARIHISGQSDGNGMV